eukprot:6805638-Pyramimonas_sp.AAC.2
MAFSPQQVPLAAPLVLAVAGALARCPVAVGNGLQAAGAGGLGDTVTVLRDALTSDRLSQQVGARARHGHVNIQNEKNE